MVFSSLLFLGAFLPLTLVAYFICKNSTYRNIVLLVSSLFFYAWGEPIFIVTMLFSSFVGYLAGLGIGRYKNSFGAKLSLILALITDIGLLVLFKYTGFIIENINFFFGTDITFSGFALPLGISFYTFQILTYVADVYRGEAQTQRSFFKFLLYVSMFPQLVAGPIVRYVDIEKQINSRSITLEGFEYGIIRFTGGMFKKVVLANCAGSITDSLFVNDLASLSPFGACFGMIMFSMQIYFDFSAYSDMAIGLGHFFGFRFRENFDYPYTSKSITEFWRRWHISLGTFFRDYVYIPLGGNRRHQLLNICIVWFLTGLWHGASWNFILWGAYYGILLIAEKKFILKFADRIPKVVRCLFCNIAVIGGWVLFYFTSLEDLKSFFIALIGRNPGANNVNAIYQLTSHIWIILLMLICCTPIVRIAVKKLRDRAKKLYMLLLPCTIVIILSVCFILLVKQSYNPFLYFRF